MENIATVGLLNVPWTTAARTSTQAGIVTTRRDIAIGGGEIVQIVLMIAMRGNASLLLESSPTKKSTMTLVIATTRRKGVVGMNVEGQGPDLLKTDTTVRERENTRKNINIDMSVEGTVLVDQPQKTPDNTSVELEMRNLKRGRSVRRAKVEATLLATTVVVNKEIE